MSVTVTFACGHRQPADSGGAAPLCQVCGEYRVAAVTAPPPRFRGMATGPHAEMVPLPAQAVTLKGQD